MKKVYEENEKRRLMLPKNLKTSLHVKLIDSNTPSLKGHRVCDERFCNGRQRVKVLRIWRLGLIH